MTATLFVEKAQVVATLRSRELHGRADWVDKEMPALIDTVKNAALLRTLDIDVGAMSPLTRSDREATPESSGR